VEVLASTMPIHGTKCKGVGDRPCCCGPGGKAASSMKDTQGRWSAGGRCVKCAKLAQDLALATDVRWPVRQYTLACPSVRCPASV
jgi:hypothetical protein